MRPMKVGIKVPKEYFFCAGCDSPDGVEGGEPSLDGIGRPRRRLARIADAHRARLAILERTRR